MVVEVAGQTVLSHLFNDDDEGWYQVFVVLRLKFHCFHEVAERGRHYRRISITKSLFHLLIKAFERSDLVELDKDNNSLFPDHLVLMCQQLVDSVLHSCNNLRISQFG